MWALVLIVRCCLLAHAKTSERGSRAGGELAKAFGTANNNPAALSKPATGVADRPPHFGINAYVGFDPPSGGWQARGRVWVGEGGVSLGVAWNPPSLPLVASQRPQFPRCFLAGCADLPLC